MCLRVEIWNLFFDDLKFDWLQNVEDYSSIIKAAKSNSIKARQLAAQLIPRFFKFFPELSVSAVDSHLDLCEAEELGVRE